MQRASFWLVVTSCLLSACSQPPNVNDYFPLEEGLSWQYKLTTQSPAVTNQVVYSVKTLKPEKLKVNEAVKLLNVKLTSDGTRYYFLSEDQKIKRLAKRTLVEHQPRWDEPERIVLPSTARLEEGMSWSHETYPYIVHVTRSNSLPDPKKKPAVMHYEIVDIDSTVTVPAGTFHRVVQVEGEAKLNFYADPRSGYYELVLKQREWYAPGVGLVKLEREEPLDLELYQGGKVTFELTEFAY